MSTIFLCSYCNAPFEVEDTMEYTCPDHRLGDTCSSCGNEKNGGHCDYCDPEIADPMHRRGT